MTVRAGYKDTELGLLPADWGIDRVVCCADVTTGAKNTQDRVDDGAYPFFVRSATVERINTYAFDTEGVLTAGDGVGTGKVFHYVNGRFDFHQRVYLIFNFRQNLNPRYFFWYFSANFFERIMQMTAKSSVDSVRREMIADMPVPLPPPAEQTAIATALNDVDALITSLEKLLAKKRDLKQAAMQRLLTGKERLPGFGGEWPVTKLSNIGRFLKGSGVRKDQCASGNLPCIRYGEIYTVHDDVVRSYRSFISPEVAGNALRLRYGDVLFAGSGETKEEIGKCAALVSTDEVYAGGDIVVLRPEGQDSLFLGYLLNSKEVSAQKASCGQGDAVVHIGARSLGEVAVRLPPLPEQTAIANILTSMDTDIATVETRLTKTRALKAGMMQELLTGRIRLL